jgi:hypothetical protein
MFLRPRGLISFSRFNCDVTNSFRSISFQVVLYKIGNVNARPEADVFCNLITALLHPEHTMHALTTIFAASTKLGPRFHIKGFITDSHKYPIIDYFSAAVD